MCLWIIRPLQVDRRMPWAMPLFKLGIYRCQGKLPKIAKRYATGFVFDGWGWIVATGRWRRYTPAAKWRDSFVKSNQRGRIGVMYILDEPSIGFASAR